MDDRRARMLELFDGRRLSVQLPALPNPGTRRLLSFLGVEVEIVSTQTVTRCPHAPKCGWNFVGDPERGEELKAVHVNLMHAGNMGGNGHADPDAGRAALDAMDAGEPQRAAPARKVATSSRGRRWTRESIIEAIQAWAREHGKPPSATEWRKGSEDHPTDTTVKNTFGSWRAGIEAAGFEAPIRGGRRSSVREPKGRETAAPSPATRDAVESGSPSPAPTEAEAGSRTDETFAAKAERILAAARTLDEAHAALMAAEAAVQAATDEWVNALGEAA